MFRKVIQITNEGVHLCDDGTMWEKRETKRSKESLLPPAELEWVQQWTSQVNRQEGNDEVKRD